MGPSVIKSIGLPRTHLFGIESSCWGESCRNALETARPIRAASRRALSRETPMQPRRTHHPNQSTRSVPVPRDARNFAFRVMAHRLDNPQPRTPWRSFAARENAHERWTTSFGRSLPSRRRRFQSGLTERGPNEGGNRNDPDEEWHSSTAMAMQGTPPAHQSLA